MPLYMDIHKIEGVSGEEIAKAHAFDVATQQKYGVDYRKYWINEESRKLFCLCEAPDAEAAKRVHAEAHGHLAEKIIEIEPEVADGFLGGGIVHANGAVLIAGDSHGKRDPAIRSILFTDIVGSTGLTQKLGDDGAMTLLHLHDEIVREALGNFGGREVKHTGDGIMASFLSSAKSVQCARQIQAQLASRRRQDEFARLLKLRVGIAAGEPVDHHDDIFGSTVQLAARLCAHAEPEQILVSNAVADLCIGKGLTFRPLGEVSLRGFDRPVHVHAVAWPV
jgi:class 3 adenylate cyclase